MNCAEFQKVLPYIIESGGNAEEEEHLRTCQVCSDLVRDLRYIADQAKLLVPMEDPSPKVWEGIRGTLERGGFGPSRTQREKGSFSAQGLYSLGSYVCRASPGRHLALHAPPGLRLFHAGGRGFDGGGYCSRLRSAAARLSPATSCVLPSNPCTLPCRFSTQPWNPFGNRPH